MIVAKLVEITQTLDYPRWFANRHFYNLSVLHNRMSDAAELVHWQTF